jgi:hypothetical protein
MLLEYPSEIWQKQWLILRVVEMTDDKGSAQK